MRPQDGFFRPDLDDLHDPLLMLGMEQAVDRLMLAQRRGERIMAYGDYDVDGLVVLVRNSWKHGSTSPYIPDRYSGAGSPRRASGPPGHGCGIIITLDWHPP